MKRPAHEHRQEYEELGYTVFQGVLTDDQICDANRIFDETITSDTEPPIVTGNNTARRQLNSKEYCEPRLSNFGALPSVLETVAMLMDRPFRLFRSSVPTLTLPGPTGGTPGKGWRGHVDWWSTPPEDFDRLRANGIVHFTTIEPFGGGFTLIPESHHFVLESLNNPEISQRMFQQQFADLDELGDEAEMRATAGDVLYYHPFLVHGASDNHSQRARKVLHTHYFPILDDALEADDRKNIPNRFHPDHLKAMDSNLKRLIGLEPD